MHVCHAVICHCMYCVYVMRVCLARVFNSCILVICHACVPKSEWENVSKQCAHPMTSLWPVQTVKRHIHFVHLCKHNLHDVFETYETAGGDYYGTEETSSSSENGTSSEEDEDGSQNVVLHVDDVF